MMRPLPWRRMWGTTARVIRTSPKKFVSKIDRACSIELSSAPPGATPKPALLTRRSMRPSQPQHLADGGFDRRIAGHVERQHVERSCARLGSASAGAIDLVASLREPRAVASPMPDEAPVTSAICLSSLAMCSS